MGSDHPRPSYSHFDSRGQPKIVFGTRSLAEHHARRVGAVEHWPMDVYECRQGGHWHITKGRLDDLP